MRRGCSIRARVAQPACYPHAGRASPPAWLRQWAAWLTCPAVLLTMLAGCKLPNGMPWASPGPEPSETGSRRGDGLPGPGPLPVQQARAYPETVTGRFVPLADFEDVPGGPPGREQVAGFRMDPPGPEDELRFTVTESRTGVGAIEAELAPGQRLVYRPEVRDFTGYTLLSISLRSPAIRDDLRITLDTAAGSWQSPRRLVRTGWNIVLVDIRRLGEQPNFDASDVRSVSLGFAAAAGPVRFHVDDIMLVDNTRELTPVPPGMTLRKHGLDYTLSLEGGREYSLSRGDDGLWRLGDEQAALELSPRGERPISEPAVENVSLLGRRRIGEAEVLEHNAVRVRLAATWYFPSRTGEWASEAVRRVRWEYAFYPNAERVTHVTLNNAGGRPVGRVRLRPVRACAHAGEGISRQIVADALPGPVGEWSWLVLGGECGEAAIKAYLRPATIRPVLASDADVPGDGEGDGFDESQGCYVSAARAGNCRFVVEPSQGGLSGAAFRVFGRWTEPPTVNCAGRAVRPVVRLSDGSALFVLPGVLERPAAVEVSGPVDPWSP